MQPFEADVGRVLDLVINSLYKDREIFLRELISNASDACDKLRYESLSRPELLGSDPELEITILADAKNGLLTIADNGIGMTKEELEQNLGTIARSGTARFAEVMTGDAKKDIDLIGRFGVGFYSAFMVADKAVVTSRKAGADDAWIWASDGRSGFVIEEAPADSIKRGTAVTLHLKDDAKEYLSEWTLKRIVTTHSDHVALPIRLRTIKADRARPIRARPTRTRQATARSRARPSRSIGARPCGPGRSRRSPTNSTRNSTTTCRTASMSRSRGCISPPRGRWNIPVFCSCRPCGRSISTIPSAPTG